jgi:WD40 repeat protein
VSDDGSVVLSGGREGQAFLWHISQPGGPASEPFIRRFSLPGHSKSSMVKACCVSADGLWAATGGNDGNILLWELAGLSPDTDSNEATAAAAGSADTSAAVDAAQLAGQVNRGKDVAAAAAATAADAPAAPQPVQLSALLQLPKGEQVSCLDLSRDGSWLAVGSRSGKVYLLPHGSTELQQLPTRHQDGYKVRCCALSPDGSKLLSAAEDARLVLWDVVSGSCVLSVHEHFKPIRGCCWSPDGRHIVTVGRLGGFGASAAGEGHMMLAGHLGTRLLFAVMGFACAFCFSSSTICLACSAACLLHACCLLACGLIRPSCSAICAAACVCCHPVVLSCKALTACCAF